MGIVKEIEDFVKQITSSKTFVDTVDFIERKIAAIEIMFQKVIKDIESNPTVIKIKDEIKNFTMKIIDEFKTRGAEFMKKLEEKITVLKVEVEKLIEVIKKEAPAIAKKAIEFIRVQWEKSQEKIQQFVTDLEKWLGDVSVKAEKFLKEILEETKKNPSLIKIKEEIKNMTITIINEFKVKLPE